MHFNFWSLRLPREFDGTGRAKDKTRLLQFIEAGALDVAGFQAIVDRHGLIERWREFERQFLKP